jgi:hypothetical protein
MLFLSESPLNLISHEPAGWADPLGVFKIHAGPYKFELSGRRNQAGTRDLFVQTTFRTFPGYSKVKCLRYNGPPALELPTPSEQSWSLMEQLKKFSGKARRERRDKARPICCRQADISLDTFRFRRMDHTVFHKWRIKQTNKYHQFI